MDKETYDKHNRRVNAANATKNPKTKIKVLLSAKDIYLKGV